MMMIIIIIIIIIMSYLENVIKIFLFTHSYSWSCTFLEKPPIVQLLKNFPAFYGTPRFTTVFTRALYSSLS
jgi:hypothetical protein